MFLEAFAKKEYEFSMFDPSLSYSWVLQHPDNKIVNPIASPNIVLTHIFAFNDVTENNLFKELIVYPNPCKDKFYIKGNTGFINEIKILDINGRIIKRFTPEIYDKQISFDIKGLNPGFYLIDISSREGNKVKYLIVE